MNRDRTEAIRYLSAPNRGLWRWAEDASVIIWNDDSTVAFREEIVPILQTLAPRALPPFGAVVLLLAACRGKVPTIQDCGPQATDRPQLRAQILSDLEQLQRIAHLPADLRSHRHARRRLAEAVFEFTQTVRHTRGDAVLTALKSTSDPLTEAELFEPMPLDLHGSQQRQIHLVASGLRSLPLDSLALRLRIGLDELPNPAELDPPANQRVRSLIESLQQDPEHLAIARAARDLLAAIQLPRRLGCSEPALPSGYADITQRGPLDRLLLSELAHDDLTLAVRIALNEALYLRHEPARSAPTETLALLLDSGIRLWGIPRILAAAVALALISQTPRQSTVQAWRAHGTQLEPVDLLSRDGLIRHLAALEPHAHPGLAFPEFSRAIADLPNPRPILITHADALDDPAFRPTLATLPPNSGPALIATVDATGRFELHSLPLTRRPPRCSAQLDLKSIFAPAHRLPINRREAPADDLPIVFSVVPFPFLLPPSAAVTFWLRYRNDTVVAVLADGSLVRYPRSHHGCLYLAHHLPQQPVVWMEATDDTIHLINQTSPSHPAQLISVPASGGKPRITELISGNSILAAHRYHDVVLVLRSHEIRAYHLNDPRALERVITPYHWIHGRYLAGEDRFHFASWDGTRIRVEPLATTSTGPEHPIVRIFDRPDTGFPWVIRSNGTVHPLDGSETPQPSHDLRVAIDRTTDIRISCDGQKVVCPLPNDATHVLLNLITGKRETTDDSLVVEHFLRPPSPPPNRDRITNLDSIGRTPQGIALLANNQDWLQIELSREGNLDLAALQPRVQLPPDAVASFDPIAPHPDLGCDMSVATWPSGSRAFFDSRGMLHLKSHVPRVPEISLVLGTREGIAGWTSERKSCGPTYYFDPSSTGEPNAVFEACQQFLAHL
jgi:hypothetical protein